MRGEGGTLTNPLPAQFLTYFSSLPAAGRGSGVTGCSSLADHHVPSLGFRVNALSSSLLKPHSSPGRTPQGLSTTHSPHLGGAISAFQPRGPHPATGGEGTTEGFNPHLAPRLWDPGHPKPVGGGITVACPHLGGGGDMLG